MSVYLWCVFGAPLPQQSKLCKPAEQIKIRSSYNLAAMSFTPTEIAAEIKKHRIRLPMNRTSIK
jgi:hypothetical protein